MWGKVVEMTQTAFRDGKLAEEAAWQTVVLIPKGKGKFRGIGLVEVTWKLMAVILRTLSPTPYPFRISRLRDLSKASYALVRSRKITYMTSSLMAARC